ncbi:hypothetical protein DXG01_012033 [Tephrocybe rancida]|nr:hypothetical protein DXG01_012033 [Tephrocybe rancida]
MPYLGLVTLAACAAAIIIFKVVVSKKRVPLPPGPPALPLIGHAHLIPSEGQDVFFYELGKKYGDVIYLKALNRSFVVLNSTQAAVDLMDRRSGNYRNRPRLPLYEMLGFGGTMAFLDDGEDYRSQKRMFQQYFGKEQVRGYRSIQVREARLLAQNLLSKPEEYMASLLRFSTAVIMDLTYGHQVATNVDPYIQIAQDCCSLLKETGPPGATAIDFLPILQHFPWWFPGTHYVQFAQQSLYKFSKLLNYPFEQVKEQMDQGIARPSFIAAQLEASRDDGLENDTGLNNCIQNAAAVAYIAGAETTSSTLAFFLLAMVLYPECQSRAQEEIQSVIGNDRLPENSDRDSLPYLECILQETSRWNHAVPLGVPRTALEDDVYKGMLIPKGCTVIANTRAITLDASIYKDATVFDPSRFLPAPAGRGEPPTSALFGFGRRKCPGRHLADESLWITIATILATLKIKRALGPDGMEIIPDVIPIASGITNHPKGFPLQLEPRTKGAVELLEQASDRESG